MRLPFRHRGETPLAGVEPAMYVLQMQCILYEHSPKMIEGKIEESILQASCITRKCWVTWVSNPAAS